MDNSMMRDMRDPLPSETEAPSHKIKKKSNKIFGFFKNIFKKKKKKKKKGKKQQLHVGESFLSSTSEAGNHYRKANVDFTKAEVFSNE